MKAIIIDDEPIAVKVIENFCNNVEFIQLDKTFNNPREALRYLNKFPADILFLDIDMPHINGIDLYKKLNQETMVIFTTTHLEYAIEGFNLNAVDYLVKPFTFERFLQAVKKAHDFHNYRIQHPGGQADAKYLFIRADFSLVKIAVNDILYIEGLDDYLRIHLRDQKPLVARMTMKAMLEKLPASQFVRIHRSFIISIEKMERLKSKMVVVAGRELPIGLSYEEEALKKLVQA